MPKKPTPPFLSRTEIAEISGVPLRAVDKAIEQRVAKGRRRRGRTMLVADEAAALALLSELPVPLSIKLKRELRNWIVNRDPAPSEEFELSKALRVAMTDSAVDVARRASEYTRQREKYIEIDPDKMGGVPVIRGTRVPVRTLAKLVEGGESRRALKEDYPHIPEEAYDIAVLWARGNPKRGRPAKRGRRQGSRRVAVA